MWKFAIALLALPVLPHPAPAQEMPADLLRASILPGWQTSKGTRMVALQVDLAQGWKTYWRSPGDAGIPPDFDWAGSSNVAAVRFHWPTPEVFHTNGMQTIGYHRQLVLPIEVTPADPAKPVGLRATVDMGVCRDVCVPTSVSLSADLAGRGADDPVIEAALHDQPRSGVARSVSCTVDPIKDGLRITARMTLPPQGTNEVVAIEPGDADIWASPAEVTRHGDELVAVSELVDASGAPFALNRSALRLTVLGDGRAVDVMGCPAG